MYSDYSIYPDDQIQTWHQVVVLDQVYEYPRNDNVAQEITYSSFVIVYRIHNDQLEILAEIKDTSDNKKLKLPGGGREVSDRNPAETAVRELFEETGNQFQSEKLDFITDYEFLFKNKAEKNELRLATIFAIEAMPNIRIISCLGDDIAGHKWVSKEEFIEGSRQKSYVYALQCFLKWHNHQTID